MLKYSIIILLFRFLAAAGSWPLGPGPCSCCFGLFFFRLLDAAALRPWFLVLAPAGLACFFPDPSCCGSSFLLLLVWLGFLGSLLLLALGSWFPVFAPAALGLLVHGSWLLLVSGFRLLAPPGTAWLLD